MARSTAVWGIDIGQCALKALRCRAGEGEGQLIAEAFDYIEYPKILSQPGADPAELIGDALKLFLSRNSVKGDSVAISVSGQAGLARFIKLPPVEAKKIPDIVRYEARQQIPFDLNDVIWDYQRMGGGSEEEGFALETEVGLFAMKREEVFRRLEPFQEAGIDVDIVQLAPLALYNFALFDLLADLPPPDQYDPENPPESIVLVALGTDATDLVVTNGYRVWQRSIPLGGSHFTKALTKELKLTFANAEHLKRNAAAAQDPKAVFQAMRPVFNDLLTELNRSINYFANVDRAAKIKRVVALGNAIKLPGLRRFLSQSLGYEIERIEAFRGLVGPQVVAAPAFKDNLLCFGACYGLVLQGLGKSGLRTNLLPRDIVKDRLIQRKKPWAVAAVAALLAASAISFASYSLALSTVDVKSWQSAESRANAVASQSKTLVSGADEARKQFHEIDAIGKHLVGNVEGRILWLEMLKVLNECLPHDAAAADAKGAAPGEAAAKGAAVAAKGEGRARDVAKEIASREQLHVTRVDCQYVDDVATWFKLVNDKQWYQPLAEDAAAASPDAGAAAAAKPGGAPAQAGPSGPGWIIAITGYHYHNLLDQRPYIGAEYVRNTLMRNLQTKKVSLPSGIGSDTETVSVKDLGLGYPVLINPRKIEKELIKDPNGTSEAGAAQIEVPRFDFEVQVCWQQTRPSERHEKQKAEKEKEKAGGEAPN